MARIASHVAREPAVPGLNAVRQIPLAIGPTPLQTFDSFVTGANGAALAHLRALASSLPRTVEPAATPLYLWGPRGSGKTHLLRALAQAAQQRGLRAGWFDAASPAPWQFDAGWSLLLLDDLRGPRRRSSSRRPSRCSSRPPRPTCRSLRQAALPPVDLALARRPAHPPRLGPCVRAEPLAETDSRAALRREADRRGIFLSDEVMDYLLTRFARDLQHLMALLDRLDEFALSQQRAITVPLLKRMLEQEGAAL